MLDQTFETKDKTYRTNTETLEVLNSVYNSDDNTVFKFVLAMGLKTGDIVEESAMTNLTFNTTSNANGHQVTVGVRWQEYEADELVTKEKMFSGKTQETAEAKLDRFCDKLPDQAKFAGFLAWLVVM